jgi:diketogulonate reductase-like aldo/keto reductase
MQASPRPAVSVRRSPAADAQARSRLRLIATATAMALSIAFAASSLAQTAAKHRKTTAQVLLRWALQHDVVAIPKSARPERIAENAALYDFELAAADMAELDRLDEGYRTSWDPTRVR